MPGDCWDGHNEIWAKHAGVSVPTIKRVEANGTVRVSDDIRAKLQTALESAGVAFIAGNGGGPGVRLHKDRP